MTTALTDQSIPVVAFAVQEANEEAIRAYAEYDGSYGGQLFLYGLGPVEPSLGRRGAQLVARATIHEKPTRHAQNRLAVEWWQREPDGRKKAEAVRVWYADVYLSYEPLPGHFTVTNSSGATREEERGTRMAMMFAFAQTMLRIGFTELRAGDEAAPHLFREYCAHARSAAEDVRKIIRGEGVAFP